MSALIMHNNTFICQNMSAISSISYLSEWHGDDLGQTDMIKVIKINAFNELWKCHTVLTEIVYEQYRSCQWAQVVLRWSAFEEAVSCLFTLYTINTVNGLILMVLGLCDKFVILLPFIIIFVFFLVFIFF